MTATLYIPDISGFSKFVNETEITHGQEIIAALLGSIIETNTLKMDVSEIEGDAIIFYQFGEAIEPQQFYNESKKILEQFHKKIGQLNNAIECECGACKAIKNLTLKFIVHADDTNLIEISKFKKLYGKGVIVAHLLLKNNIPSREYLLFTKQYMQSFPPKDDLKMETYNHSTEHFGEIETFFVMI